MADWSRIVNTTIKNYIREVEIDVLRNRKVPAMLKAKGRITFNWSGDGMDWKVRFKRAPMIGYADTDTLTFARLNRWKTAQLDYRGYATTDSMTKQERLKNKSTEAIVKVYDEITRNLVEDMEDQFGDEFYIDGNAAGNSKRLHGIESFLGDGGVSSGGFIALPSDEYAGINTALGTYGGTWTGTSSNWPKATGDGHFDFWSPLLVDYTDTAWAATTKTWPNTCEEAMRFGLIYSRKNKSKRGAVDFIILDEELYRQFLDKISTKERIIVDRGDKNSLVSLGFTDVTNFDGAEVTTEYGLPANIGYGWNIDQMELRSQQGQLFVPEGPDYDIATKSWRFSIDFFGNMVFRPRYFLKFKAYT
jgi:hypothetical protein